LEKRKNKKRKIRNDNAISLLTLLWPVLRSMHHIVDGTESGMMSVMASVGVKIKN